MEEGDNKIIQLVIEQSQVDIEKDFNEFMTEFKKANTTSYTRCHNYGTVNKKNYCGDYRPEENVTPCDDRRIMFYEFSNIDVAPRIFGKVSDFIAWCKECSIWISKYNEDDMRKHTITYATCYPGCTTIMIKHDYKELKEAFERYTQYRNSDRFDYWD